MARNWDGLSDNYRHRLESGGVSRDDYESGAPLSHARGHVSRDGLIAEIQGYKAELYGENRKWNEARSLRHIDKSVETGQKRTVSELKEIASTYRNAKRSDDFTHDAIYYQLREDDMEDAGFYN